MLIWKISDSICFHISALDAGTFPKYISLKGLILKGLLQPGENIPESYHMANMPATTNLTWQFTW